MSGIGGSVNVFNGPSYTHVNIDDSADGASHVVTIGAGGVSGLAPAPITFSGVSVNTVSVRGSSGNNTYTITGSQAFGGTTLDTGGGVDTTNVQATPYALAVNTTTSPGGSGNDVVNLGSGGSVQSITGAVTILNNPSRDQVFIDDSADGGNRNVTISSGGVSGLAPAAINFTSFSVSTLSVRGGGGTNTYTVSGTPALTSVTLDTGAGVDTTNVQATSATLAVNTTTSPGGSGNDSVNLGSAGSVQSIFGAVTILNNPSRDQVSIDDSADGTGRNVTISSGGVTGLAPAALNFTSFSVSTLSVLGSAGNDTFTLTGSPAVGPITLNGEGGTNTLVGPNAATTWNVTGANAGNLTGGFNFSNFQNLTGGSAADAFNFSNGASESGTVDGGGGTNTLNLGAYTANLTVNVTGANAGNVPGVVGAFANVQNVTTGSGNDTFALSDGASLSGVANGGGGSNTLNESAYTTPVTVNLVTGAVTGLGGIGNIQNFIGGSGNNTLLGPNAPTTWTITAQNAGSLTGGITFSAFQNLIGGSAADTFVFGNGVGVDGNIDGGGGSNMLDYLAYTTSVAVDLTAGTATGVGGSVANIQVLRGGQSNDTLNGNAAGGTTFFASPGNDTITGQGPGNTLVGTGAASTWSVAAQNAGTLTWLSSTTTFSGIQNLTGGAGGNTFALSDAVGVDGNINGGAAPVNTLDLSAYSTPVAVNLAAGTATGVGGTFVNLQSFVGSTGGGNTLTGTNAATTWNINGTNSGTLSGGITFANFGNLTGGSGNDSFVFANGASVSGNIDGGGGTNALNYAAYSTSVVVDLQTSTATGVGGTVANILNVTGGTGGGSGIYNILVGNGGNTLTGGDGRRNLLIAGASHSVLQGGNDDDILIGGTTAYDLESDQHDLIAIMAYWSGTSDDYNTRVGNLLSGNGVPLLDATMVTNNGGNNTLTGHHGGATELNLYYGLNPGSETTDYNPVIGEQFINC
jgi:hypothetical protein